MPFPPLRPSFFPGIPSHASQITAKRGSYAFYAAAYCFCGGNGLLTVAGHAQVSLEIELACRAPAAEACVSAKARYMNSFYAAWVGQMFPWILPFVPAFI